MVEKDSFVGVNQSSRQLPLPLSWQSSYSLERGPYFLLTDADLIFCSPLGRLKASDLIIKNNPVLFSVFQRKGKKITEIIDATCGYSLDSSLLLKNGAAVKGFESNAFAQIFIHYLMLTQQDNYQNFALSTQCFSSIEPVKTQCLYLDPMFDDKRKRCSRLSMQLLSSYQKHSPTRSLELLKEGLKKVKAGCIIVKSSKRQKSLLQGFSFSTIDVKSVRYWRYYTNYQEITDEHFS